MQPIENQDATYLPKNSVDRSLLWLILGALGMLFLMLLVFSQSPPRKKSGDTYLSRKESELKKNSEASGKKSEDDATLGVSNPQDVR
ncbi:MAG: hypothetical protein ACKVT0_10530 [Planctomycetaceae bacterium]